MSVPATEQDAVPTGEEPPDTGERHRLTAVTGLAALSLDAMASVAYGPEAIVLVLAAAGAHGLGFTLPVTLAIAALLAVLVASYRQVIAAFPDGGGSYAVARRHLGARTGLVAAASLVLDYVLNVAVAVTAGVAALTSALPGLYADRLWLCLAVLVLITAVNLRGIVESAKAFIVPTVVFVGSVLVLIAVGLFRSAPVSTATAAGHAPVLAGNATTVGALLLLKAFASGCSALTGVEAIANAVPSFRVPRTRRAQRAEAALGAVLGVMLIGLSLLISRFHLQPVEGVTVLAQLADASLGHNWAFYVIQSTTMTLLALSANTSFGGLPVLLKLLARDNHLVVALPLLVLAFETVHRAYSRIGERLGLGRVPEAPHRDRSLVVVPVSALSRLTSEALTAAVSLGDEVRAVTVCHPDPEDRARTHALERAWAGWDPGVPLVRLDCERRTLGRPIAAYVREVAAAEPGTRVTVLIPETEPERLWQRLLQNQRGAVVAHAVRRDTDAVICRLRFRLP
ncbi:APC family permease [Streptomyces sp. NPDC013455]|uniref:APC family permease n=1 Tax=Streptomyces sp. NPDC013455 TaxID=3155605 RepID=UPI0033C20647